MGGCDIGGWVAVGIIVTVWVTSKVCLWDSEIASNPGGAQPILDTNNEPILQGISSISLV